MKKHISEMRCVIGGPAVQVEILAVDIKDVFLFHGWGGGVDLLDMCGGCVVGRNRVGFVTRRYYVVSGYDPPGIPSLFRSC